MADRELCTKGRKTNGFRPFVRFVLLSRRCLRLDLFLGVLCMYMDLRTKGLKEYYSLGNKQILLSQK